MYVHIFLFYEYPLLCMDCSQTYEHYSNSRIEETNGYNLIRSLLFIINLTIIIFMSIVHEFCAYVLCI